MGKVRALTIAVVLAAAALMGGCAQTPSATDDRSAPAVDALIEPLVAAKQFSGAVILMRNGRVVHARGWGLANQEADRPFTPSTPSDTGSIAKTFTAAGLWWLVHEGRLSMEQPVQSLVPAYPHGGVTVAQLLAHSNGLAPPYELFDAHFKPGQARTTVALLAIAGRLVPAPAFDPGSRFDYSNLGYDAAGSVIERISGQSYQDFVRERFFLPHRLTDSFARPARFADWPVPRTRGYRFRQGRWQDHDAYDDEAFLGASNLMLSAADLARWGSAWAHGAVLPAAIERSGAAAPLIDGRPSAINGLSWYCAAGGRRCHYTGSLNAFHAFVHWDRDRREAVAFVTNASLPPWPTVTLQRELVDRLAGREATPAAAPDFKRIEAKARATLAGRYPVQELGLVILSVSDGQLQLRVADGLRYDAYAVSREVFYVPGTDWWLAFSDDGAANLRLHLRGMYIDAIAAREEH